MPTKIFVNLPVTDLERSVGFYSSLGWQINQAFTNENAACVVVSGEISVMLLLHPFFAQFTTKPIAEPSTVEMILAVGLDTRDEVDAVAENALEAGAVAFRETEDHGFSYTRTFADPDGHLWELFWMDASAMPGA
ncbi:MULTISPECIES: VOC family protein [Subtercola]|uniref:VOC domain-containing protein n=1 Tax=Subtercola vilae TaxID=2056433 RepID=A0A4T2BQ09_9MICO|nr:MULTISPECIES: VOC family protein [Subtercola]MEA9986006.1 VOC family protein [Subtercola sp. RTI3]TIH33340.1 hypothetical protein D4765_15025 [Subtercola vilae]